MTVSPTAKHLRVNVQPDLVAGPEDVRPLRLELRDHLAVGETVILLHPPLPLVGVSMWMKRECQ